ncbi:SAM-dependent methyltransferase [Lonsdalea quercina]|uniref:SAM-dependent methyltransferase n=1 Tax=Lonsdalea quercina TaxID=71657 RepID=UPI0039753CA8
MKKSMLSHTGYSDVDPGAALMAERQRIADRGDLDDAPVSELLRLFDQLCEFPLGRFLILNKGLDAFWTNELVTWTPENPRVMHPLERIIFEQLPATLATRERYSIFCRELKKRTMSGGAMASVPCGLMTDLLHLAGTSDIRLVGIDLDEAALSQARALAEQKGVLANTTLIEGDAWQMTFSEEFDVLTSNGLTIYESSDERVTELYRLFYRALKKGGTLVTSFMTPPPSMANDSSWKMERLDPALLRLQKCLFMQVIGTQWNAMRTEKNTVQQLTQTGFRNIRVINDHAGLFPTVLAEKG